MVFDPVSPTDSVMSSRIVEHVSFLKRMIKLRKPKSISHAILTAEKAQVEVLIECFSNLHKVPFSAQEKRKIIPFIPVVRHIAQVRDQQEAKRLLSVFGQFIFPIVLPAVVSLVSRQ